MKNLYKQTIFILLPLFFLIVLFGIYLFIQKNVFSGDGDKVVRIISQKNGITISESTGYKINKNTVLTTAHSVFSDDIVYNINSEKYSVVSRNEKKDIAYLQKDISQPFSECVFEKIKNGERVYSYVFRDGKVVKKEGKVLGRKNIVGYQDNGMMRSIDDVLITDLNVKLGDSGSPIWNAQNNIVGLIHIVVEK